MPWLGAVRIGYGELDRTNENMEASFIGHRALVIWTSITSIHFPTDKITVLMRLQVGGGRIVKRDILIR